MLASLKLDVICDFRREEEQQKDPSLLPEKGPVLLSLSITPCSDDSFFTEAAANGYGPQAMFDFMVEINRDFTLGQTLVYRAMFSQLLLERPTRMLFHCVAGKDRTGFAAAIILLALGVPRDQVMAGYLLTSEYFLPHRELDRLMKKYQMDMDPKAMLPILEVHPQYLQAALDAIDETFDIWQVSSGWTLPGGPCCSRVIWSNMCPVKLLLPPGKNSKYINTAIACIVSVQSSNISFIGNQYCQQLMQAA